MAKKPFPTNKELEEKKARGIKKVMTINKLNQSEYQLIELSIKDKEIIETKVVHTDIPVIVLSRLFQSLVAG